MLSITLNSACNPKLGLVTLNLLSDLLTKCGIGQYTLCK